MKNASRMRSSVEVLEARIAPAFAPLFELGTDGFRLEGVAAYDFSGRSVSDAGDVNGDGFDDVVIGAELASRTGALSGVSYVVFGQGNGTLAPLSVLNGRNGFQLSAAAPGDRCGVSVSGAGDVNGDGFDDVIVGAQYARTNGVASGASYVIFGRPSGFPADLPLSSLNGANGFKLSGVAADDRTGFSVSGAGDVNGDGFADLIIGARDADVNGDNSGASYVVFGKAGAFAANLSLASLDGSNGFRASGSSTRTYSGIAVSSAGDVNGDGFADVMIGTIAGVSNECFVIFGKAASFGAAFDLVTLDGSNGFKVNGAASAVSAAGDVNGDGFDDVIIGARSVAPYSGASYVVFGKPSGYTPTISVGELNGTNGFKMSGFGRAAYAGSSVSSAGDLNGDGFADLIIGAPGSDANGIGSGESYIVFGKPGGFTANNNLADLNGRNGFAARGAAPGDESGFSVSSAGDVNGDGFSDVIIGADRADPRGNYSGASYIVFGRGVELSIRDAVTVEGDAGSTALAFTVSLSEVGSVPVAVKIAAVGGTALVGGDFSPLPSTNITFAPGELSKSVSIALLGDTTFENDETFSVVLSDATGGVIRDGIATGTILNDDAPPVVSISDASLLEGDLGASEMTFTVSLSAASELPASVTFGSTDGTALAGSDYIALAPGRLTFGPGETTKTISVSLNGDTTYERDESFGVVLSEPTNATIADSANSAVGTIRNDDGPPVVSVAGASVLEGDTGTSSLIFTASLSAASGLPATVNFASAEGTAVAGSDYTALVPGTLTFAVGETTKTIAIEVLGDTSIEDHESLSLVLSEPTGATIGTGTGTGTILNDDTAIHLGGSSGSEGDSGISRFGFRVTLEKPSALPVTVNYMTADGTANAGTDYGGLPEATITFAPGETRNTISLNVFGDTNIEDDETVLLVLSDAINARIADNFETVDIRNDDTALRIGAVSVREGDAETGAMVFTLNLEKPSANPVTVVYETVDGTAIAGSDYESVFPTEVTFEAGETIKPITVNVFGDTEVEADETFSVILSGASGAIIAEGTATGTILNDDTLIRITDASLLEGHSGSKAMMFTVSLSAPSALPVSVTFATSDGTATGGADYAALTPTMLEFAPGETSKTVTVDVLGDTLAEASETFSLVLSAPSNAVIDDGTGVGTILDDDVTLVGPHKATFTDADGELVRIKVSKGTLKVEDFTIVPNGLGAQLALVDFSGEPEFAGTKLSISAKAPAGVVGDGLTNVGYINATGVDLGKVKVKGDLGQIDAGHADAAKPALKSLSVGSLGARGLSTQLDPATASLQSDIAGDLRKLAVKTNVASGVTLAVSGRLGSAAIIGNVDGAKISALGLLAPANAANALAIGSLTIGGNVTGSQLLAGYDRTGSAANADASIGTVFVKGSWTTSNLIAGTSAGPDGLFGTEDDALIAGGNSVVARIASILIKGSVQGTELDADHFGFVAQQIVAFKAAGANLALTPGPSNDLIGVLIGTSGDTILREVA